MIGRQAGGRSDILRQKSDKYCHAAAEFPPNKRSPIDKPNIGRSDMRTQKTEMIILELYQPPNDTREVCHGVDIAYP
jgi:hypothetical protein